MEVLTYKTSTVSKLLNEDIIINNLKETDKISDPRYIMSAGTAWLRMNRNCTLYDLQITITDMGLNTVILARPIDGEYQLCLPSSSERKQSLKYVADFISNPYIIAQLPMRSEGELSMLKYAGYSCSNRYASKLGSLKEPNIDEIEKMDVHTQLQWAYIKFTVEHVIVNPDEELAKDLYKASNQGINVELRELTLLRADKEKIYAYIDTKTDNYISSFGILEKTADNESGKPYAISKLAIHLPTYLHDFEEK